MIDRIKNRLNSQTSQLAVDVNSYYKLKLDSNMISLPIDEINKIIDVGEQFNKERQSSGYYRIIGNINPVISNILFNPTTPIDNSLYTFYRDVFTGSTVGESLTLKQSIRKYLKEVDGWFGYDNPIFTADTLCDYIDLEPTRDRFKFTPDFTQNN